MNTGAKFFSQMTAALLLFVILFLQSCSLEKVTDPGSVELYKLSKQPVELATANGLETDKFYDFESVLVNVFELEPLRQYCLEVALVREIEPFRRGIVVSDSLGRILNFPVLIDLGYDPVNNNPILPDLYEVRIQGWNRSPFIRLVKRFNVIGGPRPNQPFVLPMTDAGEYNGGTVLTGGDLYANGGGFSASTEVRLYVINDVDTLTEGETLVDVSGGFETVTTGAGGELPNTLLWSSVSASPGTALDIVADTAPFGEFNAGDAFREGRLTSVVVQNSPAATDIVTELTVDMDGMIQNTYTEDEDIVFVKANPPQQPLFPSSEAGVYIAIHKDTWQSGDRLVVVSEAARSSHEMPNFECLRPLSGHKSFFPIHIFPGLPPGRYDVIVDVGSNHIYDTGTDILDGSSQIGFTIPGAIDSVRLIEGTDSDFLFEGGATRLYALMVRDDDSPIPNVPVKFSILDNASGTLSVTDTFTETDGIATTIFSGGSVGDVIEVLVEATLNGVVYRSVISIWIKVSLHNQGSIRSGH